jgi:hypothetical protein
MFGSGFGFGYTMQNEETARKEHLVRKQQIMDERDSQLQATKSMSYLEEEVKRVHEMAGRFMDNFTLRSPHWKSVMGALPKEFSEVREGICDLQDAFGYLIQEYTRCLHEGIDEVDKPPIPPPSPIRSYAKKSYKSGPTHTRRHQKPGYGERVYCDGDNTQDLIWDDTKEAGEGPPLKYFVPQPDRKQEGNEGETNF